MSPSTDPRTKSLAAIHAMKRELALDDDVYRDTLEQVTGKRSAGDLDEGERARVLEHFRSQGAGRKDHGTRPTNMDLKAELTKVEALLAEDGLAWGYADGIAKRMFKVEKVQWCNAEQLRAVITALVKRQQKLHRQTLDGNKHVAEKDAK